MLLHQQVAIVTGSGQGIGKAIALRFASEGANIGVVDINSKTATGTAQEITKMGQRATVSITDVSKHHEVETSVKTIASELDRIDILVNNVGIEKRSPFLEITPEDWQKQLEVNLTGAFYFS